MLNQELKSCIGKDAGEKLLAMPHKLNLASNLATFELHDFSPQVAKLRLQSVDCLADATEVAQRTQRPVLLHPSHISTAVFEARLLPLQSYTLAGTWYK